MARVQISIDDELLDRVDKYAEKNYLTRSGFITQAASEKLMQVEAIGAIKQLQIAISSIAKKDTISKEDFDEIQKFEIIANMLIGK